MGEHREKHYSRGIRQRVYAAAQEGGWYKKYRIMVGGYEDVQGTYSELLARSVFCLVMPGGFPCWRALALLGCCCCCWAAGLLLCRRRSRRLAGAGAP
jgi:hypothetical protein